MPLRRLLAIALIFVVVSMAVALWTPRPLPLPASATAAPLASAPAPAAVVVDPVARVAMPKPSALPAASSPASPANQVDAWARSPDPRDAMQAYAVVFRCLLARRRAHAPDLPPDDPALAAPAVCGDLRSDQVQSRMALLERAARAGIRGAAGDFIEEGPSGNGALADLGSTDRTPPTPEWLARRNDYIERALANCDLGLATYLGHFQRDRDSRQEATQYWVDRTSCDDRAAAISTPLASDPKALAYLDRLTINGWNR